MPGDRLGGTSVTKEIDRSLFEVVPDSKRNQFLMEWEYVLLRMSEAVAIDVPNSLKDRLAGLDDEDLALGERIDRILDGTTRFQAISLPSDFRIHEQMIHFGSTELLVGHNHTGGIAGDRIKHVNIEGITPNDHHAQAHAIDGPDHIGSLSEGQIAWSSVYGHTHDGVETAPISHTDIIDIGPNDHHPQLHDISTHAGLLWADAVWVNIPGLVEDRLTQALIEIVGKIDAHDAQSATDAHDLTTLELVILGVATAADLAAHVADPVHDQVALNTADIILLGQDIANIQVDVASLFAADVALDGRITPLELDMPLKMFTSEFVPRLVSYGGAGSALGGIAPIENGYFTNLFADTLMMVNLLLDNMTVNDTLTVMQNFILDPACTVAMPDKSIEQTWIKNDTAIPSPIVWTDPPTNLPEDLNNLRYIIAKIAGEPWFLNGANPPDFTASTAYGRKDIKTFEETEWYYNWLIAHEICRGMVFDTFIDDTGYSVISDPTKRHDHMLEGAVTYTSKLYQYDARLYDIAFVIAHVETNNPAGVSIRVTVNATAPVPAYYTIAAADFDLPVTIDSTDQGKHVKVEITLAGGTELYSYGILLGVGVL